MIARKLPAMHAEYGTAPGLCKDCCNFARNRPTERTYRKCKAYGDTACESTDWRASNMACGLYNVPFETLGKRPLIEVLKCQRKAQTWPVEGQIGLELTQ